MNTAWSSAPCDVCPRALTVAVCSFAVVILEEASVVVGELRFEGLSLTVGSVATSLAFYGGLLGLEVAHNAEPAFAMIKVGGAVGGTIGLLSIDEARKEGVEASTAAQKRAIHVEFTTDDLDALYEQLIARGVIFHEPPHDEPWERVMTAFDPDGYAVEIAQGRRGQSGQSWTEGS